MKNFTFRLNTDEEEMMLKECAKFMDVTMTEFIKICTESAFISFKSHEMTAKKQIQDLTDHEKEMRIFLKHLFDVRNDQIAFEELKK